VLKVSVKITVVENILKRECNCLLPRTALTTIISAVATYFHVNKQRSVSS